jgi:hypothetical protein
MTGPLSRDWLRRHFATATAPAESLYGDEGTLAERAGASTPAAVLVPIVDRGQEHPGGLTILFTVRAPHLKMHSGQVSFPGGRVDPQDASPEAAALRARKSGSMRGASSCSAGCRSTGREPATASRRWWASSRRLSS